MKIRIAYEMANEIESALSAANGKASTHTFSTISQLVEVTNQLEKKLDKLGLVNSRRKNVKATIVSGRRVANSFKFSRNATRIVVFRGTRSWYLTEASRVSIGV